MSFFKKLKTKIEDTVGDLSTLEHALYVEQEGERKLVLYRRQQIEGDSIIYINDKVEIDPETMALFNEAVLAGNVARNDLAQFLIESLTKPFKIWVTN